MPDLIITGIPRSGTSLAAAIVDKAPDALCLSEPERHVDVMQRASDAADFVRRIKLEFDGIRRAVLSGEVIEDRRDERGSAVTNYFSSPDPSGKRRPITGRVGIARSGLSPDFLLGIKHNALYAAVLPEIVNSRRFRVVAVVRDPVAVLMSWRSLDLPISTGRLPAAEQFWPRMAALTDAAMNLTEKQIRIHDLLCRRFARWADRLMVVPYEAFAGDPGQLLAALGFCAERCKAPMAGISHQVPSSIGGGADRAAIAAEVRRLSAAGELLGIVRFYPGYGKPT